MEPNYPMEPQEIAVFILFLLAAVGATLAIYGVALALVKIVRLYLSYRERIR